MPSLGIEFGAQFPLIESIEIQVKNWTFIFLDAPYALLGALKGAELAVVLQTVKCKRVDQAQVIRPIAFSIGKSLRVLVN